VFALSFPATTGYFTKTQSIQLKGTGDDRHYLFQISADKGSEAYFDLVSLKDTKGRELIENGDFSKTTDGTVNTDQPVGWGEADNRVGYYYGSVLGAANGVYPTGVPGGGPTVTPAPATTVSLALKLKLQGITKKPANSNPISVQVKLGGGSLNGETAPQTTQFTVDDNGVWTGKVSFLLVSPGSGYRVYVKGPKHIQKKVCVVTPTETDPGTYHCADGAITLKAGDNSFDFSGITQMAGDLPQTGTQQNGIIDSYDTTFIRTNLGATDSSKTAIGDLNLDNIIDTQDMSMIYKSLSIKYDDL
jgi:hypothetical protein